MGADLDGNPNEFSDGDLTDTVNLVLINNLYWNGGFDIPKGDLISPSADVRRIIGNPMIETNHEEIILPIWLGEEFLSGRRSITLEYNRLVNKYAKINANSPAVGKGFPFFAPQDDIFGNPRINKPDIGAYQHFNWLIPWLRFMIDLR